MGDRMPVVKAASARTVCSGWRRVESASIRCARALAWIGLFGVPAVALLTVVASISVPSYLGLLMFCWFVAGFGYLVLTMNDRRGDHDDGWDDGAVL